MGIFVEANFKILNPWLKEKCAVGFCVCFAHPPSTSKEKIMIMLDKKRFHTLSEIEKEIGEPVFTITVSNPKT